MPKIQPKFSVIIPTLNEENYLPNLLDDLVNQQFKNFETIVVDGRSEDKTVQKAKHYESSLKSLIIVTSKIQNVSYQRNLGAQYSFSDWLIFLDADVRLPSNFLVDINRYVGKEFPDILSSWNIKYPSTFGSGLASLLGNIYVEFQNIFKSDFLLESFMCIKKTSFFKLGGFDTTVPWGEGGDLLKRAYMVCMQYHFIRNPKYYHSIRRSLKVGKIKLLYGIFLKELSRHLGLTLSKRTRDRIYPMKGGEYYG